MCFMSHAEASDSMSLRGALVLGTCRPRGTPSVKAQQPRGRAEACPGAGLLCRRGAAGTERRPGLALPVLALGPGPATRPSVWGPHPEGFRKKQSDRTEALAESVLWEIRSLLPPNV